MSLPSAALTTLAEQTYAMICRLVCLLVVVLDVCRERDIHLEDGMVSMEDWTRIRLGIRRSTACEYLRLGRASASLPAVFEKLADGELSVDQTAAVSRYATAETDERIAHEAVGTPVTTLDRRARLARRMSSEDADVAHRARRLQVRPDFEGAGYRLWGWLPAAEGAVVAKVLEREADRIGRDPVTGELPPAEVRLADALIGVCRDRLAADAKSSPERATVVVHVDAAALASGEGVAEVQGGPPMAIETARRLLCDADVRTILESGGRAVGIGRRSRRIPPAMEQAVRHRDGGCVFLGCGRNRWVDVHHIDPYSEGGRTELANLALICTEHHQWVHEGGWTMEGNPYIELIFRSPEGHEWRTGPTGLHAETKRRFFGEDPADETTPELPEEPDEDPPPYDDTS